VYSRRMISPILDVQTLTKRFGNVTAVDGISFRVNEGEIVGLLGPNGAGKTTTLSMLIDLIEPTSGTIRIFGLNLKLHREEILKQINFCSAYTRAPWRLTVWEHIFIFARIYEVSDPRRRTDELLDVFHLTSQKKKLIGDLSAGNIARLNLCKAFINEPRFVLMDEPTSSLDPDIADRVREFIMRKTKERKTTILITSHNMAEIEEVCDRVIFMSRGKIIAENTPEELAKKTKKTKVRLMMKDGQKRTIAYCQTHRMKVSATERYVTVEIDEQRIAQFLHDVGEIGADYREISIDKPTLSDYFIGEARDED